MNRLFYKGLNYLFDFKKVTLLLLLLMAGSAAAQEITVLPWNGSFSPGKCSPGRVFVTKELYF